MPKKPCYITTPIYYVNGDPHIGSAYTTLACDVLARFKRLDDFDVFFLTGTDEYGQKVAQSAEKAGLSPQEFTDKVSVNFRELCKLMNFSNDDFIRTTEPRHHKAAQELWNRLLERGEIYEGKYAGWYAVRDEAYYGEDELQDVDGKKIAPTGAECIWVEEPSYFFKLSAWQDRLLELYDKNPDFVAPKSRRNEVISFVKSGLRDLSVSRTTFDWGVPVPNNPKHVMYVWLDALTNYLTALGFPDNDARVSEFFPTALHTVGKDILRFHAVYWPAFLMAAELPLPARIFAHGWWTVEGEKMAKSIGNVVAPVDLVNKYGLDPTRYFLMREVPFGNDGDFSHGAMIARVNAELANGLGNLVQRVLSFVVKNCDAEIPQPGNFTTDDNHLLGMAQNIMLRSVRDLLEEMKFHLAIEAILSTVKTANEYIDKEAPWGLKKTDPERMKTVLYVLLEAIRNIGLCLQPFMPDSSAKILNAVAVPEDQCDFTFVGDKGALKAGTPLPPPQPIFPRFEQAATT